MTPEQLIEHYGGGIALLVLVAQILGRAIPDNATGFLAVVRKFAKVIGIYVTPDADATKAKAEHADESARKALAKVMLSDNKAQRAALNRKASN